MAREEDAPGRRRASVRSMSTSPSSTSTSRDGSAVRDASAPRVRGHATDGTAEASEAPSPGQLDPARRSTEPRPPWTDVGLAAALALVAAVDLAVDPRGSALLPAGSAWLVWPVWLAMFVPLAWRRVRPLTTMTITGCATGLFAVVGVPPGAAITAVVVALYSVAAYGRRTDGVASLAISGFFIVTAYLSAWWQGHEVVSAIGLTQFVVNLFAFAGVWALGDRTRVRRLIVAQLEARAKEAERSQQLAAQLAVADERRRIARELHDVVAHAVSVVVVQASAGRRVVARDPDAAGRALAAIEGTGRDALGELRHLVGVLREDDTPGDERSPQPTLDTLPELVGRLREVGIPVTLRDHGDARPVPPGVAVSAYRIAQEALTNVLKHAGPVEEVLVEVVRHPDRLSVAVEDDGDGAATGAGAEGSGLLGMRERAAVFGGSLRAGPRPGGGFVVRARLPYAVTGGADTCRSGEPLEERPEERR